MTAVAFQQDQIDDPSLPASCLIVALRNGHSRKRAENCTWERSTGRGSVGCPDCPYAPSKPVAPARARDLTHGRTS